MSSLQAARWGWIRHRSKGGKMLLSRWIYYLSSIPTLLFGIKNWFTALAIFLGFPIRSPFEIELRNGLQFKVRTAMDIWIIKETCLDRDYERNGIAIKDGWVVLDIGAAMGDFAICVAKKNKNSVVYAYEPFPDSFALFKENMKLNQVYNIHAFPYAVGAISGPMDLQITTGIAVQHSTAQKATDLNSTTVQIQGITLDRILQELNIQRCDFLKIDCEGGEYDILFHASKETLDKIKYIHLEYHDGFTQFSHRDLVRFFEEKGFHVKTRRNPAHSNIGFLFASNPAPTTADAAASCK
jgi:FkbM family methyltransferase